MAINTFLDDQNPGWEFKNQNYESTSLQKAIALANSKFGFPYLIHIIQEYLTY